MTHTVHVRMTRAELHRRLAKVPNVARQGGEGILKKAGEAVLKRVHKAFIVKSRGGMDEAGERWTPLARLTILKRLRKQHPTGDKLRPSSALSPESRSKWWSYYRQALARVHDKGIAARIAWSKLKRKGGVGLFDKYGAGAVPILRDTEDLADSLNPASDSSRRIFRFRSGELDMGTNRVGALAHHRGIPGKLPRRRLWPPVNRWPASWWQEMLVAARLGLIDLVIAEIT